MNHPQAKAIAAGDFEYSPRGIAASILTAGLLAAYAYALHTWPPATLFLTGTALAAQLVTKYPR